MKGWMRRWAVLIVALILPIALMAVSVRSSSVGGAQVSASASHTAVVFQSMLDDRCDLLDQTSAQVESRMIQAWPGEASQGSVSSQIDQAAKAAVTASFLNSGDAPNVVVFSGVSLLASSRSGIESQIVRPEAASLQCSSTPVLLGKTWAMVQARPVTRIESVTDDPLVIVAWWPLTTQRWQSWIAEAGISLGDTGWVALLPLTDDAPALTTGHRAELAQVVSNTELRYHEGQGFHSKSRYEGIVYGPEYRAWIRLADPYGIQATWRLFAASLLAAFFLSLLLVWWWLRHSRRIQAEAFEGLTAAQRKAERAQEHAAGVFDRALDVMSASEDTDALCSALAGLSLDVGDALMAVVVGVESQGLQERGLAQQPVIPLPRSSEDNSGGESGPEAQTAPDPAHDESPANPEVLGDAQVPDYVVPDPELAEELRTTLHRLGALAIQESCPVRVTQAPGAGPALAIPLRHQGMVLGALALVQAEDRGSWSEPMLTDLTMLAVHGGAALAHVQRFQDIKRLSVTDALTGVGNVRHMNMTLSKELARAQRYGRPMSILMVDLDHFKSVNDTYGHGVGDQVLVEVSQTLAQQVRTVDTITRYGGEEFVVVLPETSSDGAQILADRILDAIRSTAYTDLELSVTASIGIACYPIHGRDLPQVLRSADSALYQAKSSGRNQVVKAKRVSQSRSTATSSEPR